MIRSGLDVEVLHRKHPPRTPEARLHLIGDEDDAVPVAQLPKPADELRRGGNEPSLTELRLEHDRGDRVGRYVLTEHPLELCKSLGDRGTAIRVRERRPVHLRCEWPHSRLVGMGLRGHRQRQQRATVEATFEGDDGRAARVEARELHRVLDRFGAGIEERRTRATADRRKCGETLGELDVAGIGQDGEIGVEEASGLLGDRLRDARVAVPHVDDAHATCEIDEDVAIDVGDRGTVRALHEDGQVDAQGRRDRSLFASQQFLRTWAGQGSADVDDLCPCHAQ